MLPEKLKNNIDLSLRKIEVGDFDYDNIVSLFMSLRNAMNANSNSKKGCEILYDIFDSVAHSDNRTRGIIFNYSKDVITSFITSIKLGGSISVARLDMDLENNFEKIFTFFSIAYDKNLLNKQILKIKEYVYTNILKDTKIKIKNNDIESCSIIKSIDGNLYVSFKVKPFSYINNGLTITGNPTMQFRLM